MSDDNVPRIAAVQRYLSDERAAGRCIFILTDAQIAALLAAADQGARPIARDNGGYHG